MSQSIHLVVFDADDTLWFGLDGGYIAGVNYQDEGNDNFTFQRLDEFQILRNDGQRFQLFSEVPGVLEELHKRGTLLSLASYNHSGPATRALQVFGIHHYFQNMAIEFHSHKDRMLLDILNGFWKDGYEVTPKTTLFIDDDHKGKYRQQMADIGVNFLQRGTDIQNIDEILNHSDFTIQSAKKGAIMPEPVIINALRTPIGALGGALSSVRPDDLAALVIRTLVEKTAINPADLEEIYLGCANQAGEDNRNVARMAALLAGIPVEIPAVTFNRLCASGLAAINTAARAIRAGDGDLYIAGGVESMSRAPYSLPKAESGFPFGNLTAYDTALGWRYPNPKMQETHGTESMGETAENIAAMMPEITRQQQDEFSLISHQRAIAAIDSGKFAEEIIPVTIPQRKGDPILVTTDERPRRDTSMESLGRLKPAFRKDGTVTAGNSSGLNDGAAAVLIASAEKSKNLGLKPMARVVASAAAGVPPRIMGLGPVPATQKALARGGLTIDQIGLVELNEAFAVQSLAVIKELGLSQAITNVNGGAIALGHPLGCSGARILTTLLHEMRRLAPQKERPFYGLATLCVGVGQGEATIIEWLD